MKIDSQRGSNCETCPMHEIKIYLFYEFGFNLSGAGGN